MKSILEFELPDENQAFRQAVHAIDLVQVIELMHAHLLATHKDEAREHLENMLTQSALPYHWFGIQQEEALDVESGEAGGEQLALFQ